MDTTDLVASLRTLSRQLTLQARTEMTKALSCWLPWVAARYEVSAGVYLYCAMELDKILEEWDKEGDS